MTSRCRDSLSTLLMLLFLSAFIYGVSMELRVLVYPFRKAMVKRRILMGSVQPEVRCPDETGPDERSTALEQFRTRHLHFYYMEITNPFLTHVTVPLLIQTQAIYQSRKHLPARAILRRGIIPSLRWICTRLNAPVTFDPGEAHEVLRIEQKYEDMDTRLSRVRRRWLNIKETFDDAVVRVMESKETAIASFSDNKHGQETTEKHWPVVDSDEDESNLSGLGISIRPRR
ncbi:hypothetical protein TESG_01295 [Trichophyton tonsurans CBS 112818]|uniref:Uncharacterized protein n=2 Tax=Trichophyton TaxID=5550 RepID=F2Q4P3_TRIEC|nr:hypothetical protein TESG_01295 [Trichophyton tonsurans CBS 112818]EGE09111.1 hypothetical protein TEQG_08044 [Trichophyton equinum CBS 127.97]